MGAQLYYTTLDAEPVTGLAELDDVVLLHPATALDGTEVAEGTTGTIMSVLAGGAAYTIEFAAGVLLVAEAGSVRLAKA